jgi:Holliday junction resolvase
MPRTEADIQSAIIAAVEREGHYVIRVARASRAGVPDLIVCARGRFIALEVKRPGEKPTKIQLVENRRIEAAGGEGYVVRSVDDALACLRSAVSAKYEV